MKLIRGAPGSGKTALVFREFKDELRTGRAAEPADRRPYRHARTPFSA